MNYELKIRIGQKDVTVYLQSGFFDFENITYPLHRHCYTEGHIFLSGGARLYTEGYGSMEVHAGNVLFVPPRALHRYEEIRDGSGRVSFLIAPESGETEPRKFEFPESAVRLLY